jgi:hypothetical protein
MRSLTDFDWCVIDGCRMLDLGRHRVPVNGTSGSSVLMFTAAATGPVELLPGRTIGNDNVLRSEDGWKVCTGSFKLVNGTLENCEPGEVVLSGVDNGTGISANAKFRSNGTVDEAYAPFADWSGRRVHQDGTIGPIEYQGLPLLGFYGDHRLN